MTDRIKRKNMPKNTSDSENTRYKAMSPSQRKAETKDNKLTEKAEKKGISEDSRAGKRIQKKSDKLVKKIGY